MRAVEQELVAAASIAGGLAKPLDDGVLAARHMFHRGILPTVARRDTADEVRNRANSRPAISNFPDTIPAMKARILRKFEDEIMHLEKELKTELPREIQR